MKILLVLIQCTATCAVAALPFSLASLTTTGGQFYKDVTLVKLEKSGVKMLHAGGIARLNLTDLPSEVLEKVGITAAAANDAQRASDAAKDLAIAVSRDLATARAKLRKRHAKPEWVSLTVTLDGLNGALGLDAGKPACVMGLLGFPKDHKYEGMAWKDGTLKIGNTSYAMFVPQTDAGLQPPTEALSTSENDAWEGAFDISRRRTRLTESGAKPEQLRFKITSPCFNGGIAIREGSQWAWLVGPIGCKKDDIIGPIDVWPDGTWEADGKIYKRYVTLK
jgi:hypothetical protein